MFSSFANRRYTATFQINCPRFFVPHLPPMLVCSGRPTSVPTGVRVFSRPIFAVSKRFSVDEAIRFLVVRLNSMRSFRARSYLVVNIASGDLFRVSRSELSRACRWPVFHLSQTRTPA